MPPKGSSRRSGRGAKPGAAHDTTNGTGHHTTQTFKDEEPVKPRRGAAAKARNAAYALDEPKAGGRGGKLAHPPSPPEDTPKEDEDDEGGETRCICDPAEAETKDMGFMVQCEECEVWQHGICMGIELEEDCPEKYYCELCRPDLHPISPTSELNKRSQKLTKKSKSHHSSRTSRSSSPLPTPDARKATGGGAAAAAAAAISKSQPKRRNTMNSRETDLEHVLDLSRKEAERAGLLPESGPDSVRAPSATGDDEPLDGPLNGLTNGAVGGRGRKRKRPTETDSGDGSRKKRAAGSPDSAHSDHPGGDTPLPPATGRAKSSTKTPHGAQSPALADVSTPDDSTPVPTSLGRGKRAKKDKDAQADLENKSKHPNQYTYRGTLPLGNNLGTLPPTSNGKSSPVKTGKAKNAQSSGRSALNQHPPSPSPIPLSYNVPDHFTHLVPLLPHPTPQGISVPVRVELTNPPPTSRSKNALMLDEDGEGVDNPLETRVIAQTEKGVKVRWPPKRTTIGEMRRRVRSMMEYVARAQLDAGERERRVELLKTAMAVQAQAAAAAAAMGSHEPMMAVDASVLVGDGPLKPTADEHATVPAMTNSDSSTLVDVGSAPLENAAKEVADEEMEIAAADNGQPLPSSVPSSSDTPGPPLSADEVIKAALHPDAGVNGASSSSSSLRAKDENGPSSSLTTPPSISTPRQFSSLNANLPTTTQLLDELTRELIQFQEQFGAGREGKVYVTGRVEARERRTRAAAPTGPLNSAGPEIDI